MSRRLGLVHTVSSLAPVFESLATELLPGVALDATVDEALLAETIAAGEIPAATADRLGRYVDAALTAGSDLVLVTCSSVGPAVDGLAATHHGRVLRIDEAMADRAVELGDRIGVVATLRSTLEPTAELIRRRAAEAGRRPVSVEAHLVAGAFAALRAGDTDRHDRLVREALEALLPDVEVIVLAQASMARVVASLPEARGAPPILSSPRLAMERVAERLAERGSDRGGAGS